MEMAIQKDKAAGSKLPEYLHDFVDVFSKWASQWLLKSRPYNMKIRLKADFVPKVTKSSLSLKLKTENYKNSSMRISPKDIQ